MPGKEIKGRSKRANYRHGGRTGFFVGGTTARRMKEAIKGATETAKKHIAKRVAKKTQDAKDKIQKSEMGYKKGGRAGFKEGSGKKQPIAREDTKEYKEWYKSKLPTGRGG